MCNRGIQITFFIVLIPILLWGQNIEKLTKKADRHFQLGHYAKAIPLYKEALAEKTNGAWLTKLADCYRLTNQIELASETYETLLFATKRIRPKVYFKYAEVLVNQGNYKSAKEMLETYLNLKPDDSSASNLLNNLGQIKEIKPIYSNVELSPFNHNSDADDHGAVFLDDGIVFVSDRSRGLALFKESNETTGREFLSLYFAPRTDRLEYGEPIHLPRKINKLNKHTGPATFTKDGKTIVYSQNNAIENKRGIQTLQLYIATRDKSGWKNIEKISFCNENLNYMHPAISPDGNMLFFVSDKSRGVGGTDIYVSHKKNGKWGRPENLGPFINSEVNEGFPYYHEDGRLYFCSKGHLGFGGYDIFYSEKDEYENWSKPINLGQPINSSRDDISFCLNQEGNYGLFTSSREGGDDDIYLFRFKEDNMVVALEINYDDQNEALSDTKIKIIPKGDGKDTTDIDISSDKTEIILENNTSYDIIIMKEGFEQFTKKVDPSEIQNTFLKMGAQLKKKE